MNIRYLGHAAFVLEHDGVMLLIDPFLSSNPSAPVGPEDVDPDVILVTHGHFDHTENVVAIAKRTGSTVVAIKEVADEFSADLGDEHPVIGPNLGGTVSFDWGSVRLVPAWHTSTTPKGTVAIPAGLVIELGGKRVYHLGDTALFSDLALPGRRAAIDVALIPIGGFYTMDRVDAVVAAELVGAAQVIPCHYDTFPPIAADAQAYKADVEAAGRAEMIVLAPGEVHAT